RSNTQQREYTSLFSPDAWVVDVSGHRFWIGRSEIESRLLTQPEFLVLDRQAIPRPQILGDTAEGYTQTRMKFRVGSDVESHTGLERWTFSREKGNWWGKGKWLIRSFEYNLASRDAH